MKIVHIIGGLQYGGAERLLLDICKKIDSAKFEVRVVSLAAENPMRQAFEDAGVAVETIVKKGKMDLTIVRRLQTYLKEAQPDIVHTHLFAADFYGGIAARRAGVARIISTKHDYLNEGFWRMKLGAWARRKCVGVVAISNAVRDYLVKNEKVDFNKVKMIYNGIDINKYYLDNFKLFDRLRVVIGTVGRFSKEKGHKHLIRACRFLPKGSWELVLVGDGALQNELRSLVKFLDIQGEVKFTGAMNDVRPYLNDFDIFVLPSVSEGLSLAVLEAGAAGKLVIATNVGGVPEIIEDKKTGLLFKPKSIEQLVNKLKWVFEHKEEARKLAANLQKLVAQDFDMNKIIKKYEEMYSTWGRKR